MNAIDQVRLGLVRERGLPDSAAPLLKSDGGITEMVAEADVLAEAHGIKQPDPEAPNAGEIALLTTPSRKDYSALAFIEQLHGGPVEASRGFDGGARQSAPVERDEEANAHLHGRLIAALARKDELALNELQRELAEPPDPSVN
jgi:hypothetical protein